MALALAQAHLALAVGACTGCRYPAPVWQPLVPGDYLSRLDDTTAYLGKDLDSGGD